MENKRHRRSESSVTFNRLSQEISMRTFVIAEAGVNHNGSVDMAKKLCAAAKESGADAVKFQTWITEKIITRNVRQAEYQRENTQNTQSQFDMLKALELPQEAFREIKAYCDEIGIVFASTADEQESLDFLIELGIPFIKVGSGEVGNIPYLRYIGGKHIPVILSTGMSSLSDVDISLQALIAGGASDISLLHCTTSYPCPYDDVNLKAMDTLREAFQLPVGYSDHTRGIEVPIAAVARGAVIIEKHFTLDRSLPGPDHPASTEPGEFRSMVDAIRNIEAAMGTGVKRPAKAEESISEVVLKRIVAKRFISAGMVLSPDDLTVKRNDEGLPAGAWDYVIGTRAKKDYNIDEGIIF